MDHDEFNDSDKKALLSEIDLFEKRFSRFLPESEVNQFRSAQAGTYELSELFQVLLMRADRLRVLTGRVYDPAVGGLLEHAGYGPGYRLTTDNELTEYRLPRWTLEGGRLTIDGPAVFDFGGIGKGYCIDLVAQALERRGYQYFLVEGGGDMYGTTKRDDSPYRVALEWPGQPDVAFGVVTLRYQGVAVSDSFKRRWPASAKADRDEQAWHHIVDPHAKKPIARVVGGAAIAPNAFAADCMTSGIFLATSDRYEALSQELQAEYVVFEQDGKARVSPHWPGELFS